MAGRTYVRKGLEVHRTAKPPVPEELRSVGHLRYSSFPRTLIELAPRETPAELDRLIAEAARKRLLDPDAIQAVIDRHAWRPGLARLQDALVAYRPHPNRKSDLERAFDAWLLEHPRFPSPGATSTSTAGRSTAGGPSSGWCWSLTVATTTAP